MTGIQIDQSLGQTYVNKDAATEFASCIAEAIRGQLLESIRSSPCFSIMLDESYDLGWKCQLMMCVRFLDNGRARTVFLRLIELRRRYLQLKGQQKFVTAGEALSIAHAVREQMVHDSMDFKKMVCMCTDGANAMLGAKSGAGVLIKQWCQAYLLHYHCVAHKLALASKQAPLEHMGAFLEDAVRQILGYYSKSGDRRAILSEIQEELGINKLKLLKLHKIRWLSLASVVDRIFTVYSSLRLQFERESEDAGHILSIIERYRFLGALAGVRDILIQQALANKIFQKTDVHFMEVRKAVKLCCSELHKTYIKPRTLGERMGGVSYKKVHACACAGL